MAVRVDQGAVVYHRDGHFYRATAKALVLAGGSHTSQHLIGHLADARRRDAFRAFNTVPVIVANVAVRSAAPLVDAGLGYNEYLVGQPVLGGLRHRGLGHRAAGRPRPADGADDLRRERGGTGRTRRRALQAARDPVRRLRAIDPRGLSRVMAGTSFDVGRDITAIFLYRWGHGLVLPSPGLLFGAGPDRRRRRGGSPQRRSDGSRSQGRTRKGRRR